MIEPDADQAQRVVISHWAATWALAVETQAERVLSVGMESATYQTDAYLFALAVREVLWCFDWAKAHVDDQRDGERSRKLNRARAAFDDVVPDAVAVRDILTHFDAYERGKGELQPKGREARRRQAPTAQGHDASSVPVPPLLTDLFFSRDGKTTTLHLLGYALDVATARDAATGLADAVIEALR